MFQTTSSTLIVGLLIGAVLAMVLSSSAASIGLILTLAATGALPVVAALALMLGANVGTTLTALLSSLQEGTLAGRRLALVHTETKLVGALVLLAFLGPLASLLAHLWRLERAAAQGERRMEQIPPEAVLGATAYHLGLPCATHPATVAHSNGFYTLIVAILVGGLLVNSLRTDQWIWLLPAGLALLLLFGLLASTLVVRHTSMVICTQGLLRIAGRRAESIRWEEMREVWQNAQGFLTVERPDGARFVINATFRAWEQLAATVEQEVLRLRLPQLWEQYQHGTPVRFGPIQVDQHGIWHDRARLPWEDYGGMSQYEGLLLLQQQDEQPWMWIALAEVPNLFLLEALLERISPETLQESKTDDEHKNQKREKNEPR